MATDMQQQAQGNPQLLAQRLQQLKVSQARQSQQSNSTPPRGATDSSLADPRSDSDEDEHSPDKPSSPAARSPQQHQQQRAAARAHAAAVLPPATAGPDAAAAAAAAMHNPPPVADGLMTTAPAAPAAAAASGGSACRLEYFQPHDGYGKGCPAPPCFEERVGTALGIHRKMELRDGELESTLRLLCKVFDVETATVSLLTGERVYLVAACGALPVCVCPDRWGFCGWSFLNPNHELNVVENMEEDARFSHNFFVVNETFRLVFYVMAPLISSNGHRVGTLCIMGQQPRKFDATRGAILANLSELLVRQIERRWALQEAIKHDGSTLKRGADAYTTAVGFVDASKMGEWQLLHLNGPAVELLGVDWRASYSDLAKLDEGRHFQGWEGMALAEVLDIDMSQAAWQAAQVELVLRRVRGATGTPCEGKLLDVTFRLAASDGLDEHAPFSVGIPSWLRTASDPGPGRNLFFMHIRPASSPRRPSRGAASTLSSAATASSVSSGAAQGVSSEEQPRQAAGERGGDGGQQAQQQQQDASLVRESGLAAAPRLIHESPIPDLVIGPLLGKGGYGKVFRGVHKGQEVAVKIITRLDTVRVDKRGVPIEVALTQDMHHLGVARSLAWGIGRPLPQFAHLPGAAMPTCWIIQELCDRHTLVDAVVKGWFRTSRDPTQGGTHLRVVALTAYEVASAMAYIHSHGIAHLDLSGGNVLLTSCPANAHGFTARVTDFGLARSLDIKARTAPGRYGTVTHMAPETIREGELSPACDVYAFGVLLWEMITGSRAWAGLTHEAILEAVRGPWALAVPPGLPPVLQDLLLTALSKQPEHRPTFREMLPKLEWYLQLTRDFELQQLKLPLRSTAPPGP